MLTRTVTFFFVLNYVINSSVTYNVDTSSPVILEDPQKAGDGKTSYFGFSLTTFVSEDGKEAWVFVGAPKGNRSTGISWREGSSVNSGALFGCRLKGLDAILTGNGDLLTDCKEIDMHSFSEKQPNNRFVNGFDDSWIGVSLDIISINDLSAVWICGHRWTNEINKNFKELYVNGACYWKTMEDIFNPWNKDMFWNEVLPLTDIQFQIIRDYASDNAHFYYAMGQAGISTHFKKNTNEMLIGAPGLLDWTGSVITTSKMPSPEGNRKRRSYVETFDSVVPKPPQELNKYSYLGYTVSSGVFWNQEEMVVAGAPRADYKGKVLILSDSSTLPDPFNGLTPQMKVEWSISGPEVGSYFGSALAVVDVSRDGKDEIFVGAPFHSQDGYLHEGGGVWVYKTMGDRKALILDSVLLGNEKGGRFGAAVAPAGDLDLDGFKDIVIGSPNENENHGAIYIFRGSEQGIIPYYSQKISAKQLNPILRSFGMSFSHEKDLDGNGYSDLVIGSPESDSTVVLLSRKVINVESNLQVDPISISKPGQCFRIILCVSYLGHHLPPTVDMNCRLEIDSSIENEKPRAYFEATFNNIIEDKILTKLDTTICQEFPCCLNEEIFNVLEPIQVKSTLTSNFISPETNSCPSCMILSPVSNMDSQLNLVVTPGCGKDGLCSPTLRLDSGLEGVDGAYTLGSGTSITLWAEIEVEEEWAYETWVSIDLPAKLLVHSLQFGCYLSIPNKFKERKQVKCDWKRPIQTGIKESVKIRIDENSRVIPSERTPEEATIIVSSGALGAPTSSIELKVPLEFDVSLKLFGTTNPEILIVNQKTDVESLPVQFTFQIVNRGITHIIGTEIEFWIPEDVTDDKTNVKTSFMTLNDVHSSTKDTICTTQSGKEKPIPTDLSSRSTFVNDFILRCDDRRVKCTCVTCILGYLGSEEVFLSMESNNTGLKNYMSEYSSITFESLAIITNMNPSSLEEFRPAPLAVFLTVKSEEFQVPMGRDVIPWWVYALSVIGAIFILGIIVDILYKLNFFKRKLPPREDLDEPAEGADQTLVMEENQKRKGQDTISLHDDH